MWKILFDSGFLGKILFGSLVCLLIWFMQLRFEIVKKQLVQKEEQYFVLQNVNKKQQESIARLQHEQQKQQEIILQAEQEKKKLVQEYRAKQKQVYKSNDKESLDWKQGKIPDQVLQILRRE